MDLSRDHLIWDFSEPVTFVSRTSDGDMADYRTDCLRRQITTSEAAASGGVYQTRDVGWLLPGLGLLVEPKPGDQVLDVDGRTWTVLRVDAAARWRDGNGLTKPAFWRLTSRDLALHYDLRDRIDLERPTLSQDAARGKVKEWQTLRANLSARVQPAAANEVDQLGVHDLKIQYNVWLSENVLLTREDRIKWGARYLEVTGWTNAEQIGELMLVNAALAP